MTVLDFVRHVEMVTRVLRLRLVMASGALGFVWGTWGLVALLAQSLHAQPKPKPADPYAYDAVSVEHRFTQVETQLGQVLEELRALKGSQTETRGVGYILLVVVSGVAGETGFRLTRKKPE